MDYRVRRKAILLAILIMFMILATVVVANWRQVSRILGLEEESLVSAETQEAEPVKEGALSGYTGNYGAGFAGANPDLQMGEDLHGYENLEGFFNEDESSAEGEETDPYALSMVINSVEKDMRIQIVDPNGNLVTGETFYVNLNGAAEYKDLDKDGVIYIGGLRSGNYQVMLMPVEGYSVPEESVRVVVKDKVVYTEIPDISLLIKTEADIDAEKEDTGEIDALDDADGTEITHLTTPGGNGIMGIDVSKWNGEIDWQKVADAGVEFAIIRCGYRGSSTGALVIDPMFRQNIAGAKNAGIKTGVYFFTQATTTVEAVEEASMVIELCRGYNMEYPAFIDTEGAGGNGRADTLDVTTRTQICNAFCETLEDAGMKAGVYASRNWLNNRIQAINLEKFVIWLAEYRKIPEYAGYYQMWQYTSSGSVDGIEGRVDLDISYLDVVGADR
ncbi:MAG: glycoside hydrolase family 25 protein [Lachnospiraceae bacterium]|nr:glycoside hydrolase family 25 protein [Lachnospiraceae bacterium]